MAGAKQFDITDNDEACVIVMKRYTVVKAFYIFNEIKINIMMKQFLPTKVYFV